MNGSLRVKMFDRVLRTCNFIKKQTLAQALFCEFYGIFKNNFITEHVLVAASF